MIRLLLTGGSGFLGCSISKAIKDNCIVSTLSRSEGDYKLCLENDVPNFKHDFDIVVHAAGLAHYTPRKQIEIELFQQVNVVGTQNLLKALAKSYIPKYFVYISSVSVYGLDFGRLIDEDAPLKATDPYGKSKIEAEEIVIEWCKSNNVICTVLRLPLLIGPNPPGNLGSMIKGIQVGYYFNVSGGTARKSMVLVEDVAKFLLKAAEIGGIYNLTDGYHPSFAEISKYISFKLGKVKPINIPICLAKILAKCGDLFGNRAPINSNKLKKITSDLTFDDTKAREAFGWNPTPVLEGFKLNSNAQ